MTEPAYRLGDLIDDFCPRCRLLLNHAVASLVADKVVKVICQTCYSEPPFRHGEGGKTKKKPTHGRAALFEQVLSQSAPLSATPPPPAADDPEPATDDSQKKKPPEIVARYISRHKTKPPRKKT